MNELSSKTKDELQKFLADMRMDNMFGDGMEDEYVWGGVVIVGIHDLTDKALVDECETYGGGDIIITARAELAIEKLLK